MANLDDNVDTFLSFIENYLINTLNYQPDDAAVFKLACNENGFTEVQLIKDEFGDENSCDDSPLLDNDRIKQKFTNQALQKLFDDIKLAIAAYSTSPQTTAEPAQQYNYKDLCNLDITSITDDDVKQICKLYKEQAKPLIDKNAETDRVYLTLLALGHREKIPLMQNLVDTNARLKVLFMNTSKGNNVKEFHKLLNDRSINQKTRDAFANALNSFYKRGLPEAPLEPLKKIDDDVNTFFVWGKAAIQFVQNLVSSNEQNQESITPFQVDFWIIPKGEAKTSMVDDGEDSEEDDSDDDDNEDDGDENGDGADADSKTEDIGDILGILDHEKLLYKKKSIADDKAGSRYHRDINDAYRQYAIDLRKQTNQKAPQFRRFNMILDRRNAGDAKDEQDDNDDDKQQDNEDDGKKAGDLFVYSPPEDCNTLQHNYVPEVFLANTKACVLPKKGYVMAKGDYFAKRSMTISASDGLNGRSFILSFHVEAIDSIRAYVFYNGMSMRFLPQDMVNVWPKWFVNSASNQLFVDHKELYLQRLKEIQLRDDKFERWYEITTAFKLHEPPKPADWQPSK